ncbi:MAG TPA: phenylalanine--tRNA ligase subunit alpha, partial [Candidatus Cloacimonadota bacterium]|nr:phenylalanine--tRNA ligase subunit alpha [Candidatus Cloacimonadota bacterium]
MQEQLNKLLGEARAEIEACTAPNDILNTRAKYLGKKSVLNELYGRLRELSPEARPAFGNQLNGVRSEIETLLNSRSEALKESAWQKSGLEHDHSMPGIKPKRGGYHPLSIIRREIDEVFMSMGFEIAEGLDIEDEFHNFDALNTPQD